MSNEIQNNADKLEQKADQNKYCIDVIASAWGKEHSQDPSIYKGNYAKWLNKEHASNKDLDLAWEQNMLSVITKDSGAAEAERILAKIQKDQNCV